MRSFHPPSDRLHPTNAPTGLARRPPPCARRHPLTVPLSFHRCHRTVPKGLISSKSWSSEASQNTGTTGVPHRSSHRAAHGRQGFVKGKADLRPAELMACVTVLSSNVAKRPSAAGTAIEAPAYSSRATSTRRFRATRFAPAGSLRESNAARSGPEGHPPRSPSPSRRPSHHCRTGCVSDRPSIRGFW